MMSIQYRVNIPVSATQFAHVLRQSGLSKRRPVADSHCMKAMVLNANLIVSAWEEDELVGIARAMTDFHYACYLADWAVVQSHQHQGIGQKLLDCSRQALEPGCKIILIADTDEPENYADLGFDHNPNCWISHFE